MAVAASRILPAAMVLVVASLTLGTLAQESKPPANDAANNQENAPQTDQNGAYNGRFANLPGAKTAAGILASSADGMSRYLAPDGPIQPALTAIGGLPMRGAELANLGISQISERFNNGAQSLSRSAGNDGTIRMPGLDALESSMPASFAQMGTMMHGAIQQKNKFIMGQAEKGVQAGERLRSMMQGMSARSMGRMGNMMGGAQDAMMKGSEEIKQQLKQSLDAKMGRMQGVMAIGDNVRNQAQGIGRTLTNGLSSTMSSIQRTGDQVRQQLQGGMKQNARAMEGIMGSMQGSMGNAGQNMQKNLNGVVRHAQNAVEQVSNHLQQAVSGPLEMVKSMGKSMMAPMGAGSGPSKGGRY